MEALKEPGPIGHEESSPGITWEEGTTVVEEVRLLVKKDAVGCKAEGRGIVHHFFLKLAKNSPILDSIFGELVANYLQSTCKLLATNLQTLGGGERCGCQADDKAGVISRRMPESH